MPAPTAPVTSMAKFSIRRTRRSRKPAALIVSQKQKKPAAQIASLSAVAPSANRAISVRATIARANATQIVLVSVSLITKLSLKKPIASL
jgi:hypothetical protein